MQSTFTLRWILDPQPLAWVLLAVDVSSRYSYEGMSEREEKPFKFKNFQGINSK
jgi:hypothetical protein